MEIPELLFKMFSFIDIPTLSHTVILVCRRWYLMNQSHITRNRGIYFNEDEANLLLNKALMGLLGPAGSSGILCRLLITKGFSGKCWGRC